MEIASFLFSLLGVLLSVGAFITAKNAKKAVGETIQKVKVQKDIPEVNKILELLAGAKDGASIWVPLAPEKSQTGRDPADDLLLVRKALDALATWVPANLREDDKKALEADVADLGAYCDKIADPAENQNHWNGVVTACQSLIRRLKTYIQSLENYQLELDG